MVKGQLMFSPNNYLLAFANFWLCIFAHYSFCFNILINLLELKVLLLKVKRKHMQSFNLIQKTIIQQKPASMLWVMLKVMALLHGRTGRTDLYPWGMPDRRAFRQYIGQSVGRSEGHVRRTVRNYVGPQSSENAVASIYLGLDHSWSLLT